MIDLSVEFLNVRLKNPIVAAAGPLTWSLSSLRRCIEAGVGAVAPKSAILDARRWEKPARQSLFFLDKFDRRQTLAHCTGWFHSFDEEARLIEGVKPVAEKEGAAIIGNIMCDPPPSGFDAQALTRWAKQLEGAGADMLELAVACPTVVAAAGLSPRQKVTATKQATKFVLDTLKGNVGIPYYVKVGYDSPANFLDLLKIIKARGGACHIQPELSAAFIDIETGRPVTPLPKLYGRFSSGVSSYFTALAVKNSRLQIMVSGGLWTWRDIVESLMSGATATAVQTAALYHGYALFPKILEGLSAFMERKGYRKMDDLIGTAVPHINNPQELTEWVVRRQVPAASVTITVNDQSCDGCGKCAVCAFDAISIKDGLAQIDRERCLRCGLCASICPRDAILLSFGPD